MCWLITHSIMCAPFLPPACSCSFTSPTAFPFPIAPCFLSLPFRSPSLHPSYLPSLPSSLPPIFPPSYLHIIPPYPLPAIHVSLSHSLSLSLSPYLPLSLPLSLPTTVPLPPYRSQRRLEDRLTVTDNQALGHDRTYSPRIHEISCNGKSIQQPMLPTSYVLNA